MTKAKVKYSPPIWTGKQSDDFGRSPFSIRNVANGKSTKKKRSWDTFLLEIGDLTKSALFGGAYPTTPQEQFYESAPKGVHKTYSIVGFLAC